MTLAAQAVTKTYPTGWKGWRRQTTHAVENVTIEAHEGETLAIVGESGSGKSTLARMLLGLSPPTTGAILYHGAPLPTLPREAARQFRRDIQPVFQDPAASLNPRMTVATTLTHVLAHHRRATPTTMPATIAASLAAVGLAPEHMHRYPHQLSGGQQQRVAIARAIAIQPRIIIADEALSSLDMTVQAQVLDLLLTLKQTLGLGLVLISHDLNLVATIADRIAVMREGRIVETGPAKHVLKTPQHAYTRTLLAARLSLR